MRFPSARCLAAAIVLVLAVLPATAQPQYRGGEPDLPDASIASIQGVWLSPDWFLPGTRQYGEAEVRSAARAAIAACRANGVNTVFFETFTRGTSIAAAPGVPIYPHLSWDFQTRGTRTLDALQIFAEEAEAAGIQTHAWVHLFYWRMDNDDVYESWHRVPSAWDDLLKAYLEGQRAMLRETYDHEPLQRAVKVVASTLDVGVDPRLIARALRNEGFDPGRNPLSCLLREMMAAGCKPPGFLLIGTADEPFPPAPGRSLRPIYLNPADPVVRERLVRIVAAISNAHPDLAGVQMDHVRYPMDAQGIPVDWVPHGREAVYFSSGNPVLEDRYHRYLQLVTERGELLRTFVDSLRGSLYRTHRLSAAVLPLYYAERAGTARRFNGYDYSAQDWYTWRVDFVVPMMYGFDPWRIRTLVRRYDKEARNLRPDPPRIVPGVAGLWYTQSRLLDGDTWVYFDHKLGLDARYEKERDEDYQWEPQHEF